MKRFVLAMVLNGMFVLCANATDNSMQTSMQTAVPPNTPAMQPFPMPEDSVGTGEMLLPPLEAQASLDRQNSLKEDQNLESSVDSSGKQGAKALAATLDEGLKAVKESVQKGEMDHNSLVNALDALGEASGKLVGAAPSME